MSFEKKGVRGYIYFQNSVFISAPLLNITPNDLKAYIHYLPSKKNSAIPLCKFYKFMPITSASFTAINTANLTSMSLIWSMTPDTFLTISWLKCLNKSLPLLLFFWFESTGDLPQSLQCTSSWTTLHFLFWTSISNVYPKKIPKIKILFIVATACSLKPPWLENQLTPQCHLQWLHDLSNSSLTRTYSFNKHLLNSYSVVLNRCSNIYWALILSITYKCFMSFHTWILNLAYFITIHCSMG